MSNRSSADEIAKLHKLLKDGIISRQEFETVKRRIVEQEAEPRLHQRGMSSTANRSSGELANTERKPRKASTVLLICGVVLALIFAGNLFSDTDEDRAPNESVISPTSTVATQEMSLALSSDDGNGEDETVYTDGVIGVLVTIPDSANWVVEGQGCAGVGSGVAGDMHAGQLAAVTPVNSSHSRNISFLSRGVVIYDGSCQFSFETDMFEADEYEITIWESAIVCQRTNMLGSSTGVMAEVIVDENGMKCRDFSS